MRNIFPLILVSVTISALAQIALKGGMGSESIQRSVDGRASFALLLHILLNPLVMLGLFLYFASAVVWLFVLSRIEVSSAYPFVALGFVFTAVLGRIFFADSLSAMKIAGTMLICAGVVVLARG